MPDNDSSQQNQNSSTQSSSQNNSDTNNYSSFINKTYSETTAQMRPIYEGFTLDENNSEHR